MLHYLFLSYIRGIKRSRDSIALFSSKCVEWETPDDLFFRLNKVYKFREMSVVECKISVAKGYRHGFVTAFSCVWRLLPVFAPFFGAVKWRDACTLLLSLRLAPYVRDFCSHVRMLRAEDVDVCVG